MRVGNPASLTTVFVHGSTRLRCDSEMLSFHTRASGQGDSAVDLSATRLPPDVIWIDMLNADPAEIAFVEKATGLHVPRLQELSEIESSSRLRAENGALYLSTPIVFGGETRNPSATPVGFVLTANRLITIRFQDLTAFSTFLERAAAADVVRRSSAGAFVGLMEAIVDRMADVLEVIGTDLDAMSHQLFRAEITKTAETGRPSRKDADLREILRRVGRSGDLTSKIRDSLLGIGRIVPYVKGLGADWLPAEVMPRFETLQRDIASLNDYDAHLANKLQLLLDATLGLINIEQNNIIKVLTIVSVVGVPPTLVASMYGMNFRHMPELNWAWGYPHALALIALSAVGPLIWFKRRGWL
jgi:magnesium transporter